LDSAETRVLIDKHLIFPDRNAAIISEEGLIPVQVMKTNKDLMIARHIRNLIKGLEKAHE
jgi:acetate kinase